jgi:hypothetical protein
LKIQRIGIIKSHIYITSKNIKSIYKKYILKTNPIDIKLLINKIISKGDCEDIDIETRKNGCELLSYAIVPLYNALGYKEYIDKDGSSLSDIWTLQLK